MAEAVPVRCPSCGREHLFASPVYPCACGAPLAPPLLPSAPPEQIVRRTWDDDWVRVRCESCGRQDHWPQPELGCPCGTLLRIPVRAAEEPPAPERAGRERPARERPATGERAPEPPPYRPSRRPAYPPSHIPLPRTANSPRPSFRPVTIRTARDAVTAAQLYLTWLGFHDVAHQEIHTPEVRPLAPARGRPAATVRLRGRGLVAQIEPTTRRAEIRDVECLWLYGLSASATTVYFTLAGYGQQASARAEELGVPLFVMDLTGMPQPVNATAAELVSTGA
ncbi:hypothetical protein ACFVIM_33515 [Streptomyces sp. NPDC057638]|uniref:hypothetical protein n=1 Tax=Streptomyces sp. NPDC057638 TaxID=3346190 RepID=UPI0036B8EFED